MNHHLFLFSLFFVAACGSPPESRTDFDLAVPLLMQDARERVYRDVELERIARLEPPDSLLYPGATHLLPEGVFVVEYTDRTVWRYDFDGSLVTTYGNGPGEGPGEMTNPFQLDVVGDTLLILDSYSYGVHRFLLDGTFDRKDAMSRQGVGLAATEEVSLIMTTTPNIIFRRYPFVSGDSTKAVFEGMGMMDAIKGVGRMTADHARFAYVNRMQPFFVVLSPRGDIEYARATIDDGSYEMPAVPAMEGRVQRPPPALNNEISIADGHLYLGNVPLSTDSSRVVDVYDLDAGGDYAYSFTIPFRAQSMSFHGDMMAARDGPTSASLYRIHTPR